MRAYVFLLVLGSFAQVAAADSPVVCQIKGVKEGTLTLTSPPKDGKPTLPGTLLPGTLTECGRDIKDIGVPAEPLVPGALVLLENGDGANGLKPVVTPQPPTCEGVVGDAPDSRINFKAVGAQNTLPGPNAAVSCKGSVPLTANAENRRSQLKAGDVVSLSDFVPVGTWKATTLRFIRAPITVWAEAGCVAVESGRLCLRNPTKSPNENRFQLLKDSSMIKDSLITATLYDPTKKDQLKVAEGDRVEARILYSDSPDDPPKFESVRPQNLRGRVGGFCLFGLLAVFAFVLSGFASIISAFHGGKLFFIGEDDTTSKSKAQASVWLLLVLSVFLTAFVLRLWHGDWLFGSIAMPTNLALLAGISGVTFVGAKAIRASKESLALAEKNKNLQALAQKNGELKTAKDDLVKAPGNTQLQAKVDALDAEIKLLGQPTSSTGSKSNTGSELSQDDRGNLSLGDFQMVMVTLVALFVYLMRTFNFLGGMDLTSSLELPDIDGSIVTLFGISHGTYLANKAATPGAPPKT